MYHLIAAAASALIALMIVINGQLTAVCDIYAATVIIHLTGLILISAVLLLKKEHPFFLRGTAPVLFSGGAIGICSTVFNNVAFGKISVSAILALGLCGQIVTSLIIDHFGFFHMPVRKFGVRKLPGLLCTFTGILFLLHGSTFVWSAVAVSLLSGASVVTSRSVNAELAEVSSPLISTWYNYTVGLTGALLLWAFAVATKASSFTQTFSPSPILYTGGLLGVGTVLMLNLTVKKMPAFLMTLIMFIGQLSAGILLDLILGAPLSPQQLAGCLVTSIGLVVHLTADRVPARAS